VENHPRKSKHSVSIKATVEKKKRERKLNIDSSSRFTVVSEESNTTKSIKHITLVEPYPRKHNQKYFI
jgi:hypothetical protein